MTLPTSGPISISNLNAEFGLGNSLSAYRGVRWYKDDNSRGFFDGASGNFAPTDMSEFYGTRPSIPVSPVSNQAQANGSTYTVPFYNTITVVVVGGTGGQAGTYGINGCTNNTPTPSGNGSTGGSSSFGSYVTSSGGAGGGGNGGAGAAGVSRTLVFDANANTVSINGVVQSGVTPPLRNTTISVTVGAGGNGGGGGANAVLVQTGDSGFPNYTPTYTCYPAGNAGSGSNGASGSVTLSLS